MPILNNSPRYLAPTTTKNHYTKKNNIIATMAKFHGHIIFFALKVFVISSASTIGKSYQLYQRLGNEAKPTQRGTITIAPSEDDNNSQLVATFNPAETELDAAAFDRMVDNGELYTLIVSEDSSSKQVLASVPGCSVRRSNLREEITLSISPTGKLMSVSYRPLISPLASKTCDNTMPLAEKPDAIFGRSKDGEGMPFKTTVAFETHKPMMEIPTVLPQSRPPPGLNWYRRNSKNNPQLFTESGGPGEEEPAGFKASFMYKMFSKYWYIILPLAVMSALGAEEPEGTAQSSGGGGAAVAGAGAAAGGAARQAQRRGKRD